MVTIDSAATLIKIAKDNSICYAILSCSSLAPEYGVKALFETTINGGTHGKNTA